MSKRNHTGCDGNHFERREFLRVGALSFLGISLTEYLQMRELFAGTVNNNKRGKAEACILLWLDGGPSHIDTWDPKKSSSFRPISTNVAGIQLSELLPRVAKQMDKLAIIRCLRTEENNHIIAHHYAWTGHRPNPAMKFPSVGSIISKEAGQRNNVPPHVMVPSLGGDRDEFLGARFLGAEYNPLIVPASNSEGNEIGDYEVPDLSLPKSISLDRITERRGFLEIVDQRYRRAVESVEHANLDKLREQAWNMILSASVRKAFDMSEESAETKDAYGKNPFGQSVLLARRLVEAGSRFVTAAGYKSGAWDTHSNNDKSHQDSLVPPLDQALSALLADLEQRGLLESTIVLVMGEFGRTYDVNANGGRDHWIQCWSMAIGGGGIRGGQIIGASDERGAFPADRIVSIGDIYATIYKAFGIDWTKEYMHPIGRPLKIANAIDDMTGSPIKDLI